MVTLNTSPQSFESRFAFVLQGLPFKQIAQLTGMNAETVRRQMRSGEPSLEFVRAICVHMNVSADWLLFGECDSREVQLTRTVDRIRELARSLEWPTEPPASPKHLPSQVTAVDGPLAGSSIRSDLVVNAMLTVWHNRDSGQICSAQQCRHLRQPWELVCYALESGRLKHMTLPSAIALGNTQSRHQSKRSPVTAPSRTP